MIRPLRKTLNVLLSLSLAIPTTGLAQNAPAAAQTPVDVQKAADAYNLKFANLEQAGPGQVKGSLAPDRFLLMEQTVYQKEIPVVRTFLGHTFRKWRLNALIRKTGQYAISLRVPPPQPDLYDGPVEKQADAEAAEAAEERAKNAIQTGPNARLTPAETIAFAKTLLPMYANIKRVKNETPIKKATIDHVVKIESAGALADAILGLLTIHEGRKDEISALADGEERLSRTVDALLTALTYDHLENGRRVDTPLYIWDSQRSAGRLNRIADILESVQAQWAENKNAGTLNETDAPLERKTRFINWWDTSIQIQDDERVLQTMHMRDTTAGVDTSGAQPFQCAGENCRFNIVKDGLVLHTFGIKAKAIATLDQFVMFIAPDSYDAATGMQYVLFLDLKAYNGLIGNEDIPVFRLPLKTDEAITSMRVQDGQVVLNEKMFLRGDFLEQGSELQQPVFNLEANLLSPDSWTKILPVVDSSEDFFSKSIAFEIDSKRKEIEGMKDVAVEWKRLGSELQSELEAQKVIQPLDADQTKQLNAAVADPAKSTEAVKLYHKRVMQSSMLGKIAHESQERTRISRKFNARLRLLASALVSPRPFASQKIKEALGAWYVRREDGKTTVMDRVLSLTNRPYVNAGVIAAGLMAAVAPDSFHQMVNLGLSVGTSIHDYVTFALGGMGEAAKAGTGATFSIVTDLGTIPRQYIWDGAIGKTLVMIPTLIGALAGLYFTGHFTFNLIQLYKDLKKPGVNGFLDRQEKFNEEYYARLAEDEADHRDVGDEEAGKGGHKKVEFSPEETAQITQWTNTRRSEIREGGLFKRLGNAIADKFDRATSLVVSPFKSLIMASMESQQESMLQAMIAAERSTAIQKGAAQSPEDHAAFWTAFRTTGIGGAFGNAVDGIFKYAGAVKDLTFSMPALELTLERWAKIWNEWAMFRFATFGWANVRILGSDIPVMIKVKPISFTTKVLYPQFMKTVALRRTGQRVLPTQLNGGMKPRNFNVARPLARAGRAIWNGTKALASKVTGIGRPVPDMYDGPVEAQADAEAIEAQVAAEAMENNPKAELEALKKFEDQIIDVEAAISEAAFRKALEALADYMTDKDDLNKLFGAGGMTNIVQKDIRELSWKSQTYVRAYYESAYNAGMEKFLNGEVARREDAAAAVESASAPVIDIADEPTAIPQAAVGEVDPTQQDAQDGLVAMKQKLIALNLQANHGRAEDFNFDVEQAKADALSVIGSGEHVVSARAAVAEGRLSVTNFLRNTKYSLIADYDPTQNPSMKRVEVVHRRLQSPGALARAVRSEVAKLLLTVPIELTARLIFTAGIYEGAMKPIQEEFFGPNSIAYGSLTSFYMIFASGFVMSMMADAWLKIQQDARQDEAGEFGMIPQGEDAQKSMLRWYFKQFSEAENSLMKNWAQSNSLAFWNMPAAVANIMLFWSAFSGRFDVSLLVAGYFISFFTPISAIHYKIDQAFERSVHFAARGIKDEKWMAHPEVQKLLIPEMQKSRFRFTLWNDIWSTIQGDWVGNIEFIPTSLGTRGFQRALFGGGLLEEYIINGALKPVSHAVTGIPVVEQLVKPVLKGCEYLLSNNNPDLKITK